MGNIQEIIEKIEITDIAEDGRAVGRYGNIVVFVKEGVPGDIADIRITKKKRKFLEGRIEKLISPSDKRTKPFCRHFGVCGGCKWQHMTYEAQLFFKQKHVTDCMKHIAGIEAENLIQPILGSSNQKYYRNKLEFTFSDRRFLTDADIPGEDKDLRALGFHIPGRFDKVLDIEECFLQREPTNKIRNKIREFAKQQGYTFFNLRDQVGLLRNIVIRTSSNEVMLIMVFHEDDQEKQAALMSAVASEYPEITSLMYVFNPKRNDIITDLEIKCYHGKTYITEGMEHLKFRISPVSFFQTNSIQAYELYKIVREFAEFNGSEIVYDLYTGTGTIANFIAKSVQKVIGVEYVASAVKDAQENAAFNEIKNATFIAGDLAKVLNNEFVSQHGKPDVVITDPPRNGMHKDVVLQLLKILPSKIVYVSCNPSTQARDVEMLKEQYNVVRIQPVDMFPHTQHIENVALLVKK